MSCLPRLDVLGQDLDAPFLQDFGLFHLQAFQDATKLAPKP